MADTLSPLTRCIQCRSSFSSLNVRHVLVMATPGLNSLSISYLSHNKSALVLSPKPLFSESLKGLALIVGIPIRISRRLRLLSIDNICSRYLTSFSPIVCNLHQKTASFLPRSTVRVHGMHGVECFSAPLRLFP